MKPGPYTVAVVQFVIDVEGDITAIVDGVAYAGCCESPECYCLSDRTQDLLAGATWMAVPRGDGSAEAPESHAGASG